MKNLIKLIVFLSCLLPTYVWGQTSSVIRNDGASTTLIGTNLDPGALAVNNKGELFCTAGTSATSLGKAEDAPHTSGDTGVMSLGVQNSSFATLNADGDYSPLATGRAGNVLSTLVIDDVLPFTRQIAKLEDSVHASADPGIPAWGVANTSFTAFAANGDYTPLATNLAGAQYVDINFSAQSSANGANALLKLEDAASASGDAGVSVLAVQQTTLASSVSTDGDYATPKLNAYGAMYTVLTPSPGADGAQSQLTTNSYISAASTNSTLATGNVLHSVIACNTTAANKYVKFYNSGAPTCGSGTPVLRIVVPPNNCAPAITTIFGMRFATGIGFCITGGASDADTTAVAANDVYLTVLTK